MPEARERGWAEIAKRLMLFICILTGSLEGLEDAIEAWVTAVKVHRFLARPSAGSQSVAVSSCLPPSMEGQIGEKREVEKEERDGEAFSANKTAPKNSPSELSIGH